MLTLLFSHTAPRPHPLGPLSLYFTRPFLSGVSSGRAARVRAATASLPRPHLVAPLWRQRQTTLCRHGASIQGGERDSERKRRKVDT
jgi:hypothetical protein